MVYSSKIRKSIKKVNLAATIICGGNISRVSGKVYWRRHGRSPAWHPPIFQTLLKLFKAQRFVQPALQPRIWKSAKCRKSKQKHVLWIPGGTYPKYLHTPCITNTFNTDRHSPDHLISVLGNVRGLGFYAVWSDPSFYLSGCRLLETRRWISWFYPLIPRDQS